MFVRIAWCFGTIPAFSISVTLTECLELQKNLTASDTYFQTRKTMASLKFPLSYSLYPWLQPQQPGFHL